MAGKTKIILRTWLPNQHGAWAMLLTPLLLVGFKFEWSLDLFLVISAWLFGYSSSFYFGLWFKVRHMPAKRARYLPQIYIYGLLTGIFAVSTLLRQPRLSWIIPAAFIAFTINLYFISRKADRHWVNDLSGIMASFAVAIIFLRPTSLAAIEFLAWPSGYLIGTIFYVKTMLRERGNQTWYYISMAYHLAITLLAGWFSPLVLFGYLVALVRAIVLPTRVLRPALIGGIEIALTVIVSSLALMC